MQVSNTSVQANWTECFGGDLESTYQHFEWGLGSTEGNSDILGFEDVGLSEGARVDGLDLANISFFYTKVGIYLKNVASQKTFIGLVTMRILW